ncbi:MAG: homocysteine S-methyltransferase family protein [Myxococcota bacterium]
MQILDGAMGTELGLRGVSLEGSAWSAQAIVDAPTTLSEVHTAYAEAGATVHTANTFRTQPALGPSWRGMLVDAVAIAKRAVPDGHVVLGSLAPVEDCYRPDLSPGARARDKHREVAQALVDAGCDGVLCETFAHADEAIAAVDAALEAGAPVWLSLTAGPKADLLTPGDFTTIGKRAAAAGAARLLVNCIAATRTAPYVAALASLGVPIGAYANAGDESEGIGWSAASPDGVSRYADLAAQWIREGAEVVGGCCGTGPAHVRALADRFGSGVGGVLGAGA